MVSQSSEVDELDQTEAVGARRLDCLVRSETSRCTSMRTTGLTMSTVVHVDLSQLSAQLRTTLDDLLARIAAAKAQRRAI